jgi:hypothetical protein
LIGHGLGHEVKIFIVCFIVSENSDPDEDRKLEESLRAADDLCSEERLM